MKANHAGFASPDKATEAYLRIRSALNLFQARPGSFFNIRLLADRMRLSPTPIREALIRLAFEEIIGFSGGRGYFVKPLDVDELVADYQWALVMQKFSIEKSVTGFGSATPPPAVTMIDATLSMTPNASIAASAAYIEAIHERIAMLSGNIRVIRTMRQFNNRTSSIRQFELIALSVRTEMVLAYAEIVGFLATGSTQAGLSLLEDRAGAAIAGLPDLVKELNLRAQQSQAAVEDLL